MLLIAGVAALLAAAPGEPDLAALERLWPGIRDSTEQVLAAADASPPAWGDSEQRIRTVVSKVSLPWLGPHVLYLEEFLHDDPENMRRQLLLQLEAAAPPAVGVRVHLWSFRDPARWVHLDRRAHQLEQLSALDVAPVQGCDLLLKREAEQFTGGTSGRDCIDTRSRPTRYVEYQLLIGEELYWYRRRVLLRAGDELLEEVIGYNWFELNEARLFTCRIDWSGSGKLSDRQPLVRLELQDQGGRARFSTPDGRKLELALHSQDWPFTSDRDALILLLQDPVQGAVLASAWAEIDAEQISIDLGWLQVRCGSLDPDSDELWSWSGAGAGAGTVRSWGY
ncbi:MAG TPA: CpcT/CpeT family chromophore lyase [Steroidobacteraceae bacterium]